MRVSTSMMQQVAVSGILKRQADLSHTQQQLASGRRILTPSQDPAGSTQILRFEQELGITAQHQRNADRALSRLEMEEGILSGVGNALQRVREQAVQGLNDSNSPSDRTAIAAEVRQRLDEVLNLANTKDGSGEYLFAGFKGDTKPFVSSGLGTYVYQGDQGQREIQISPTRKVPSSDSGDALFMKVPYSGGGQQDIFKTISDFATALESNSPDGNVLTDLDAAIGSMLDARAIIGSRINTIDAQRGINEQYSVQLNAELSKIQDLDYAEAVGRMNIELTGLQASQASFERIQNLSLFNYM